MTPHEQRTLTFGALVGLFVGLFVGVVSGHYQAAAPTSSRPKPGATAVATSYTITGTVQLTPLDVPPPITLTLTGYSPNPVTSGQGLDMTGTAFVAGMTATWNGKNLPLTVVSPAQLHTTAPTVTTSATAPVVLTSGTTTVTGPNLVVNPSGISGPDPVVWGYRDAQRNFTNAFAPGATVTISGQGFGMTPGIVKVNHSAVPIVKWTDTEIEIQCPSLPPGSVSGPVSLDILRADNKSWNASQGFSINLPGGKARAKVEAKKK